MLQSYIMVFFISMVPLIELRGAIPYSQVMGLPLLESYIIAIIGNMLPVPFIYFFARDRRIFHVVSGKRKARRREAAGEGRQRVVYRSAAVRRNPASRYGRVDRYAGSQPSRHRLQIQYPRSHGRRTSCRSHYGTGQCGRFGSA